MNGPKVSICIPSRNTRPFLEERRQSIDSQTFRDYEVIVVDDGSEDGSRQFFDEWAAQDQRVRVHDGPGKGMYAGWNDCIARAIGEYVYIATSDDTMADDFLDKTVAALDAQPDCGIAHANLKAIGEGAAQFNRHWAEAMLFAKSSGTLRTQPHIRIAPYDALLQLTGHTVFISVTQLLIRKNLFDDIGCFDGRWGGAGDFHWHMRACFQTNTVHVPRTWGGWRLHASQATSLSAIDSPSHRAKIEEMIDDALLLGWNRLPTGLQKGLRAGWRNFFYDEWHFKNTLRTRKGRYSKSCFVLKSVICGSRAARTHLGRRFTGKPPEETPPHEKVTEWLSSIGYGALLVEIP